MAAASREAKERATFDNADLRLKIWAPGWLMYAGLHHAQLETNAELPKNIHQDFPHVDGECDEAQIGQRKLAPSENNHQQLKCTSNDEFADGNCEDGEEEGDPQAHSDPSPTQQEERHNAPTASSRRNTRTIPVEMETQLRIGMPVEIEIAIESDTNVDVGRSDTSSDMRGNLQIYPPQRRTQQNQSRAPPGKDNLIFEKCKSTTGWLQQLGETCQALMPV